MESVYNELASQKGNLLDKIVRNHELSTLIMGLLGRIIYICEVEKGTPVTGLRFDPWQQNTGVQQSVCKFTSRIHFHKIALATFHKWGKQREFAQYVGQKAQGMARALRDNPAFEEWLQTLVESLDQFSTYRGIPFDELQFSEHIITREDVVILKVERRPTLAAA